MNQHEFLPAPPHQAHLLARRASFEALRHGVRLGDAAIAPVAAIAACPTIESSPTAMLPGRVSRRALHGTPVHRILETTWRQWRHPTVAQRPLRVVAAGRN